MSTKRFEQTVRRTIGLYTDMVRGAPQLERGIVTCWHCGATLKVDSAACLRSGWPKCCGETMRLDERAPGVAGEVRE